VEYVNYFLVRLAYPVLRWFTAVRGRRLPQLAQDLRANSQVPREGAKAIIRNTEHCDLNQRLP
jgi:hypothetical protein